MSPLIPPPKNSANIVFDKLFQKDWKYLKHDKIRKKFIALLPDFHKNPFNPIFRNHALKGDYTGLYSIDITGDVRAIYDFCDNCYVFLRIGTHAHLY